MASEVSFHDGVDYPVAVGRTCNWCDSTPDKPGLNARGEPCPCRCHGGCAVDTTVEDA